MNQFSHFWKVYKIEKTGKAKIPVKYKVEAEK